ncbi:MAG: ATP-binding protein [Eubacteriaceae bacterium]|nr:ATP-binding protein [Eubacteriaceae bacterium]
MREPTGLQAAVEKLLIGQATTRVSDSIEDFEIDIEREAITGTVIRCKGCGEAKSAQYPESFPVFGGKYIRFQKCACDEAEEKAAEEARRKADRLERIKNLQLGSLMGKQFYNARFENVMLGANPDIDEASKRLAKYADISTTAYEKGLGAYLYGDVGVGKTYLMGCTANALMDRLQPVIFTSFIELSRKVRSTFSASSAEYSEDDLMRQIANVDFLFLDDIGSEAHSAWQQQLIFEVLDSRARHQMPTLFSSNYAIPELAKHGFEERSVDRIMMLSTVVMHLRGSNLRMKQRQEKEHYF